MDALCNDMLTLKLVPGLEKELTNFSYVNNEVSKTIITHMNSSFIGLTVCYQISPNPYYYSTQK